MITLKNWHGRMAEDMRLRDYSRKTREAYAREARQFLKHVNKEPHEFVEEDLRAYFIYLKEERQLAPSSRNIAVHGLRFFFQHTLQQEWPIFELVRVKNPQKLPTVLSERETWQVLNAVREPVRRMALVTIYGLGLRLGEALRSKMFGDAPRTAALAWRPLPLPALSVVRATTPRYDDRRHTA